MEWNKSELNELTKQICKELKGVFDITDWELMEDFVREGLRNHQVLISCLMLFLKEI